MDVPLLSPLFSINFQHEFCKLAQFLLVGKNNKKKEFLAVICDLHYGPIFLFFDQFF